MLFLELASALPLLTFNSLALRRWQHLLILHTQLPPVQLEMVHRVNHSSRFFGIREIRKRQATENAIIEMVVESVRKRQTELGHNAHELLLLDREWDVLDHNGGRDEVVVGLRVYR